MDACTSIQSFITSHLEACGFCLQIDPIYHLRHRLSSICVEWQGNSESLIRARQ